MTTYTLPGYDIFGSTVEEATLRIVTTSDNTSFSYFAITSEPGTIPLVDLDLGITYMVTDQTGRDLSGMDSWIGTFTWGASGQYSTTVLVLGNSSLNWQEYLFVLDGDPLPSTANFVSDFFNTIQSASAVISGPFTPNTDIPVNSVQGLTFTEDDNIEGTNTTNVFLGEAGNDTITGEGGIDTLDGGLGDDSIFGGADADFIFGADGVDSLFGGADADAIYGGAGDDSIEGGAANDTLQGGDGDDTLWGDSSQDPTGEFAADGQDTLIGGAGDDILFGGLKGTADSMVGNSGDDVFVVDTANDTVVEAADEGFDFVVTTLEEYTLGDNIEGLIGVQGVNLNGTGNSLDNELIGDTGNDTLDGARGADELFGESGDDYLYGDGLGVALTGDIADAVYRLYQATLDRTPDTAGHAGWTRAIFEGELTLDQAAAGFVNSAEFQSVYGALSNSDFVTLLYNNVLDRAPDAGGFAVWNDRLDSGMTRVEAVLRFSNSQEFINNTIDDSTAYSEARTASVWSDEVYRLYQATLDRAPDLAGFTAWCENLSTGMTLETAAGRFVDSIEFQNVYGALSNSDFVTLLYNNVLDRTPDAGGLAAWTNLLDGGMSRADVVLGFSNSQEFITNTTDDLNAWITSHGPHDFLGGDGGENHMMGGILSDTFAFTTSSPSTNVIYDMEAWDDLMFDGFGYTSSAEVLANFTQSGADAVFSDQGVTVTITNTQVSALTDDMFVFV